MNISNEDWLRAPAVKGLVTCFTQIPFTYFDKSTVPSLMVFPAPAEDAVLAVEYVPTTMSCRIQG